VIRITGGGDGFRKPTAEARNTRHSQSFFARRAAKMVGDTAGATLVMRRVLFVYVFLVHRFTRAWG
jgi:hypothetical protein